MASWRLLQESWGYIKEYQGCFSACSFCKPTLGRYATPLVGLRTASLLTAIGPGYRKDEVFNVETMQPYSLSALCTAFGKYTKNVVLYLPRTSDLRQLAEVAEERVRVIHYCMEGASKVIGSHLPIFRCSLSMIGFMCVLWKFGY